jgi:hypothetical protein
MRRALALALLAVIWGALGCGRPSKVPTHPVSGKLTVSGQPAANAQVAFHPLDEGAPRAIRPVGKTAADGTFSLTTFTPGDGAPAGEYAVTVIWIDDSNPVDECADPISHDRLTGRYADPSKTKLRATIQPGQNEVNLKAAVAGSWTFPRMRDAK